MFLDMNHELVPCLKVWGPAQIPSACHWADETHRVPVPQTLHNLLVLLLPWAGWNQSCYFKEQLVIYRCNLNHKLSWQELGEPRGIREGLAINFCILYALEVFISSIWEPGNTGFCWVKSRKWKGKKLPRICAEVVHIGPFFLHNVKKKAAFWTLKAEVIAEIGGNSFFSARTTLWKGSGVVMAAPRAEPRGVFSSLSPFLLLHKSLLQLSAAVRESAALPLC